MKKLNDIDRIDFLQNERGICYWFWFKGKITRKKNPNNKEIYEQNLSGSLEWNGQRLKNGFYNCFNIMSGKWNGQTKSEFDKNYKRVNDIVDKSNGDCDKMVSLSRTQAGRIHDEFKALNRAMAAKEMGHEEIFEVFFQRAYELGSVTKQEYREYRLEKLGI
jgi:uncharacterized protein YukE